MQSPSRFFREGSASDPDYVKVRDNPHPWMREAKQFTEELWQAAWPYLDENLPDAARHGFFSRFWELYLTVGFLRCQVSLVPRSARNMKDGGPDLALGITPPTFVEAVCATPGTGVDAVPELVEGKANDVPQDEVILRFRNAIEEKHRRFQRYREKGIVRPGDACVIALNARQIFPARFSGGLPYEVRAVLPFGHPVVNIDLATNKASDGGFTYRPEILKRSGKPVATTVFSDVAYAGISALLSSNIDLLNRPERIGQGEVGADFSITHNPHATTPLPRGLLPCWREHWVDDEGGLRQDGRKGK